MQEWYFAPPYSQRLKRLESNPGDIRFEPLIVMNFPLHFKRSHDHGVIVAAPLASAGGWRSVVPLAITPPPLVTISPLMLQARQQNTRIFLLPGPKSSFPSMVAVVVSQRVANYSKNILFSSLTDNICAIIVDLHGKLDGHITFVRLFPCRNGAPQIIRV